MNRHAKESAAKAFLASLFVCVSLCCASLTHAQESTRQYDIDIGQLPLSEALQVFSQQTGLQHGYLPTDENEERLVVGPLKGHLTANEALAKLLPDGFTVEWINSRTVSIVSPPVNVPPGGVNEAIAGKDQQRSELSEEQQRSMANGGGKSGSARGPYAFNERMLVEASRIFDDLDLDVPMTVFDRQDIEDSGASTVTDLLRYVTQQPHTMAESYLGDGTQFADLRGLGFDTTLVLINGRRTIAAASSLTVNAFDLNSVPLSAVERIEIVSDSTAAVYGADAIGGVFNIVLRENVPEPTLDIEYGAASGGGVERHAAFSAAGGARRFRGSIVLDYFDRGPLLGRERDRWSNQDFTRFGGVDWRSSTAVPGNVSSATLANLPGLPFNFAAIPSAQDGAKLTPDDFAATGAQRNLESLYTYWSVLSEATRRSVAAQGEYRFEPNASVFGELLYVDRSSSNQREPPVLAGTLVPATNLFNPFGEDVLVDLLLTGLGPKVFARDAELIRAVAGFRGKVRDWAWEISLLENYDKERLLRTNDLNPERVAAALTEPNAERALNPFADERGNDPHVLASLITGTARSDYWTEAQQALAQARGPLFRVPAGPVEAVVGGEWRDEYVKYDIAPPADMSGSHRRSVSAAFAELRLPLVPTSAKVPAMQELALIVSGRFDSYSDIGDSFNRQYAMIWRPLSALTLRASYAESFRPPSLFDLHAPIVRVQVPVADPHRNDEVTFAAVDAGGNPDLDPTDATSFTTTLAFTPAQMPALRLAASYWHIRMTDTIGFPSVARMLAAEDRFPDRIVRDAPSAADIAAGTPGSLRSIDITRLNFGSIETSGLDSSAHIALDTSIGQLMPSLSATWVREFETSDLLDGSDVTRVGVANLQGSIARWRAVAGLAWSVQGMHVSAKARYVPSYDDVNIMGERTGRDVHSQTLVDAQVSLDLSDIVDKGSAWNGFEIRAGATNLFNREPPFAEVGWLAGYDPSQGELKQRFMYLKFSKKF
jgi:iron complex outermembrane recepter protein